MRAEGHGARSDARGGPTHTVLQGRSQTLEALPNLDAPVSAETAQATGTDGKSVLPT